MYKELLFKKYHTLIFICFVYVCFSAQKIIARQEDEDKKPSAIDVAAKTVLYLEFEQQVSEITEINGTKVECDLYLKVPGREVYSPKKIRIAGTGFLIKSDEIPYVVTAKHIVKNDKSFGHYWISPIEGDILSGTFDDVRTKLNGAKWFFHKDADIAIHPITFIRRGYEYRLIPKDMFSNNPLELLTLVCVVGFPHMLGKDNIRLGPLVTTCDITSWPAILPSNPNTKVIFLSKRLAMGYSGAPVYSIQDPPSRGIFRGAHTMKLIGIQSGTFLFPVQAQGTVVTQDEFSYIVPTSYLIELLNSNEVQEFEQNISTKKKD